MKANVPPQATGDDKHAQLIAALCSVGGDPAAAEPIHQAMLNVAVEATGRGHEIGSDTVYYARPRKKVAGPVRDLLDLARVGRKVMAGGLHWQDWVTAWVKVPEKTRQLVWRPRLVQTRKGRMIDHEQLLRYSAVGFVTHAPKPEIAMPGVEAALECMKATPGSKLRQSNEAKDKARETIWRAFQTGSVGGGARARAFLEFGRTIDRIYGRDLFDAKDGRHLRRLGRAVGYNGPQT
jgi:hypothetical protein